LGIFTQRQNDIGREKGQGAVYEGFPITGERGRKTIFCWDGGKDAFGLVIGIEVRITKGLNQTEYQAVLEMFKEKGLAHLLSRPGRRV